MRYRSIACFVALALSVLPLPVSAAVVEKNDTGIEMQLPTGRLRVEIYSPRVARVTFASGQTIPQTKSFSVIATPTNSGWSKNETAGDVLVTTSEMQVRIDSATGAVTFLDAQGKPYLVEVPGGRSVTPTSLKNLDAEQSLQEFSLASDESIFGLGQHEDGQWNYRGKTVHLAQSNRNIALPVLISSRGYGVLWDNPAITDVAVGIPGKEKIVSWHSEAARDIDYYFLAGPSIDNVVSDYRDVTGSAPLLGKWAYGFWQSRERYYCQPQLLAVAARYRQRHTPIDGIIQDWQYWPPGQWGSHQFDPQHYPDPAGMIAQLHKEHYHVLISIWSRFDLGTEHEKQMEAIHGLYPPVYPNVYPAGKGKWYDAFNPAARKLYWQQISDSLFKLGIDAWWLDATEPELGGHWGEIRDLQTAAGPGALVANAYPLMDTTAIYQGQRAANPSKRVFILTRSAYAGQQRNAAGCWSGDIGSDWLTFHRQIAAGLNFSISGIPYWNTDIGGFFGGSPDDPWYAQCFTRWFQFGAFSPIFRVHGTGDSKEMWHFSPATDAILVKYDQLRYRLMPYIYSTAWQITHHNDTLMRPLVMDFQNDPQALRISDQYMFGREIMVNPVTEPNATTRKVYLPSDCDWYDFWTSQKIQGGQSITVAAPIDTLPLYIRAGSILPMGPVVQYAMEAPDAPLELRIYPGRDATFILYEDAGDTYDYEKGQYTEIPLTWIDSRHEFIIGTRRGSFPSMPTTRQFRIVEPRPENLANAEKSPEKLVSYEGSKISVQFP